MVRRSRAYCGNAAEVVAHLAAEIVAHLAAGYVATAGVASHQHAACGSPQPCSGQPDPLLTWQRRSDSRLRAVTVRSFVAEHGARALHPSPLDRKDTPTKGGVVARKTRPKAVTGQGRSSGRCFERLYPVHPWPTVKQPRHSESKMSGCSVPLCSWALNSREFDTVDGTSLWPFADDVSCGPVRELGSLPWQPERREVPYKQNNSPWFGLCAVVGG